MAEEKLDYLSSDPKTLKLYRAREDSAHERANLLSTGIARGARNAKLEIDKKLMNTEMDIETISEMTELTIDELKALSAEKSLD